MESMSSYAVQFIQQVGRPDVDEITGISPTVAIEQRVTEEVKNLLLVQLQKLHNI